jgi:DNA-directed RNA polymerase subunit RPC12/RpoP
LAEAGDVVRYLCFLCGSQGLKSSSDSGMATCPRCGSSLVAEIKIEPGVTLGKA